MMSMVATTSVDGIGMESVFFTVIEGVALLLFLLGAVRMYQARRAMHWVRMGWGLGLMLLGVVCREAMISGYLEINYFPGMDDYSSYAFDLPIVSWWEPYAWWGFQAAGLCGKGLVALGFFGAAREIVKGQVYHAPSKRKGGRA